MAEHIETFESEAGKMVLSHIADAIYELDCFADDGTSICSYRGDFLVIEDRWAYHGHSLGMPQERMNLSQYKPAVAIAV